MGQSMGTTVDRVYMPYGCPARVWSRSTIGWKLIEQKHLTSGPGSNPNASPNCANSPTQADLLWPQISWVTMNPENGATWVPRPFSACRFRREQTNYLNGQHAEAKPSVREFRGHTANNCFGQALPGLDRGYLPLRPHTADVTLNVPQFPGNFCGRSPLRGSRGHGSHLSTVSRRIHQRVMVQRRGEDMGHSRPQEPKPIALSFRRRPPIPNRRARRSTA